MKSKRIKKSADRAIFLGISYAMLTGFALVCVLPFLMILTGSFTDEEAIFRDGYRLIPSEWSLEAYKILLKSPESILNAYKVTILITVVGTSLGLLLTSMTAYVLYRKDFPWRNGFAFYFFFTTLFSGGLVPWYILLVKYMHLKNNPITMVLPALLSVFNILIMRNFMKSIPDSLVESAKIDGGGDFRIFLSVILPLSGPSLATVGLFIALGYWNEWYNAMLFLNDDAHFPLQYYLYRVLNSMNFAVQAAQNANIPLPKMPSESFKLVMTVAATGPIIFLYPFVQRYFIKGITVGAVKG